MGAVHEFEKEKMIIGVIFHDRDIHDAAMEILKAEFGEIEDMSEEFSFSQEFSTYYDDEIGGEGLRRIYSFRELVDPACQADIKIRTNEIEAMFDRKINIDPGFINHGRLMLATTKETGFRVPLAKGIYTELTLFWARGGWNDFPWSYRDYKSARVKAFLTDVRRTYLRQRKELARKSTEE